MQMVDTRRGVILGVTEQAVDLLRLVTADADMPEPVTVTASDDGSLVLQVRSAEEVNRWANWLGGYVRTFHEGPGVRHLLQTRFAWLEVEVFATQGEG